MSVKALFSEQKGNISARILRKHPPSHGGGLVCGEQTIRDEQLLFLALKEDRSVTVQAGRSHLLTHAEMRNNLL